MQLLATGILSGVSSCLEETCLRPSSPIESREPANVGVVYCRIPSSAKETEVATETYVPVCSDISDGESPTLNTPIVDCTRFSPLVEVNDSDWQLFDEVDLVADGDFVIRPNPEAANVDSTSTDIDIEALQSFVQNLCPEELIKPRDRSSSPANDETVKTSPLTLPVHDLSAPVAQPKVANLMDIQVDPVHPSLTGWSVGLNCRFPNAYLKNVYRRNRWDTRRQRPAF